VYLQKLMTILLLCGPLFAGQTSSSVLPASIPISTPIPITDSDSFRAVKKELPEKLQRFLNEFAGSPREVKNSVVISGRHLDKGCKHVLNFTRDFPFETSHIDPDLGDHLNRCRFIACLDYLKNH